MLEILLIIYIISLFVASFDGIISAKDYEDLLLVFVISFIPIVNTLIVLAFIVKKFQSFFSKKLPWIK